MKPDYKFKVPIYTSGTVYLFFNLDTYKEWLEKLGRDSSEADGCVGRSMWLTYKGKTIYSLFTDPEDVHTIYHESLHNAFYILEHHCVDSGPENQEPIAYLQNWLAEKVMNYSKKYKQKQEEQNGKKK